MSGERPEIAVVIPCLNEAENAEAIARAAITVLEAVGVSFEIIFIDNGSSDGTPEIVKGLCAADPRVRLIVNTRNFGQMRSPTHGIYRATARGAVIGLCADFQDPPELMAEFIARWRAGAMIVLGVRRSEKVSFATKLVRDLGYGFFKRFADYAVIPGATGFGLYDRRAVDTLRRWRDPEPFFRGMLVESGYPLETVPYDRPPRAGGVSKNNFLTLFGFALSGLAGSSKGLLRLPLPIALVIGAVAGVTFLIAACRVVLGLEASGVFIWAIAELAFSVICFFLGLMGEQIRLISEISRNTPLVIEKERVNFPRD
jgi:glycosyltransferase involved in cell wall biosynthesis